MWLKWTRWMVKKGGLGWVSKTPVCPTYRSDWCLRAQRAYIGLTIQLSFKIGRKATRTVHTRSNMANNGVSWHAQNNGRTNVERGRERDKSFVPISKITMSGDRFATTPKSYFRNFLTARPPTPCINTLAVPSNPKLNRERSTKWARRSLLSRRTSEWPRTRTFGTRVAVLDIILTAYWLCAEI